jgi:hypothetical protein
MTEAQGAIDCLYLIGFVAFMFVCGLLHGLVIT